MSAYIISVVMHAQEDMTIDVAKKEREREREKEKHIKSRTMSCRAYGSSHLTAKLILLVLTSMYECPRPFGSSAI